MKPYTNHDKIPSEGDKTNLGKFFLNQNIFYNQICAIIFMTAQILMYFFYYSEALTAAANFFAASDEDIVELKCSVTTS